MTRLIFPSSHWVKTLAAALVLAGAIPAKALNIVLNYDSSVTKLSNSTQIQGAINYAAQRMQGILTDPVTVYITVVASPSTSTIGAATVIYAPGSYNYFQVRSALASHITSSYQTAAVASLPASIDPYKGVGFIVPRAEAKVLGLIGASTQSDGTFTFFAGGKYATDPNNREVPNQYDMVGLAEHEISQILGRSSGVRKSYYEPLDLFRYKGRDERAFYQGFFDYFSLDGGGSLIQYFNPSFSDIGVPGDWTYTIVGDAFSVFALANIQCGISAADYIEMSALGYAENADTTGPVITSSTSATATAGLPFSYTITAKNGVASYGVTTGLPTWLSVNQATGVISGTASSPGTYSMLITAANAPGIATATLTITVGGGTDAIGGTPLGGGWNYSSWFGYYNSLYYPWINRTDLGFMYLDTTNNTDLYFYVVNGNGTSSMGWLYTSAMQFPNVYSFTRNSWLYFAGGTNFYNYSTSSWENY